MTSLSVGSQTDLGYLLDASDDELGLPPTSPVGEGKGAAAVTVLSAEEGPGTVGFVGLLGLKGEIPNYDSFELGLGDPFCSQPPSSVISSRSARRVLDFLEGDGERRRSSRRGRKLVEDLSERLDGVSFGDEGIRSRDS
ncbi:hypothetical protein OIU76_021844 [Salix suchowensis]|uniref:Uncharacterized protein n=1 Tax=Salix suchowensis TaxID=1278906 RepID=A0ABQ9AJG7_9ROSI|nr:hypothetical protein OIU76_021844 [Salix suchowensis]KAJ6340155.1 hypothetical protein OIU77_007995 [Salix suchowensis]